MKHLSTKGLFLSSLFTAIFLMSSSFDITAQCNGTEVLMAKMGGLHTYATNLSESCHPGFSGEVHNPCNIEIHVNGATYIDINITLVASSRLKIYNQSNTLVKTIEGYDFNQVPDVEFRVYGDEATIKWEPLLMHPCEISAFIGNYDSDGVDANEEILTCSGTSTLTSSSSVFQTSGRKIVMTGQGMATPCEWIIEPKNATSIEINIDIIHSAAIEILDVNNEVVYSRYELGTREDIGPIRVNGPKATIRNVTSLSNSSFWEGSYTSNGVDDMCVFQESIFDSENDEASLFWNDGGSSAGFNSSYVAYVRNNYGTASSIYSDVMDLTHLDVLNFEVETFQSGYLRIEISLDGGANYSLLESISSPNFGSDHKSASFSYSGPFSNTVVIRFRSAQQYKSVNLKLIKIAGFSTIEKAQVNLNIDPIIDVSSGTINLQTNYPGGTFHLYNVEVTEINPSSVGVGNHSLTYSIEGNQYCTLASQFAFTIIDQSNLCPGDSPINISDVIYTHEEPILLENTDQGGIYSVDGTGTSALLTNTECTENLLLYENFEGNGSQFPDNWAYSNAFNKYNSSIEGQFSAWINANGNIETPVLDLSNQQSIELSFYMNYQSYATIGSLKLELSTNGGQSYDILLAEFLRYQDFDSWEETLQYISISNNNYSNNCKIRISSSTGSMSFDELRIHGAECLTTYYLDPGEMVPGEYSIQYTNTQSACTSIGEKIVTIVASDLTIVSDGCPLDCANGQIILSEDFEGNSTNFPAGWIDGGYDAFINSSSTYASSGSYSAHLRDNSGDNSSITSPIMDLSNYDVIDISMSIYPSSFETGEDFYVHISNDGGSTYSQIGRYIVSTDFTNNERITINLEYSEELSSQTRIKIECSASTNGDNLYIDDFLVQSCAIGGPPSVNFDVPPNVDLFSGSIPLHGMPDGGEFSGAGISNNIFDPMVVGEGKHLISYTYEESEGCSSLLTLPVIVTNSRLEVDNSGCTLDCTGASIFEESFENNGNDPEGWNFGSYASAYNGYAASGSYSLRLRDDNNTSSIATSPAINLSGASAVDISMSVYTQSFEGSDEVIVLLMPQQGESFTEIGRFKIGADFVNYTRKTLAMSYEGELGDGAKMRIKGKGSSYYDIIYIDDITITPCYSFTAPEVFFSLPTTILSTAESIELSAAIPQGGTFIGPGVHGTIFNPSAAGTGVHEISYLYESNIGCNASLTKGIVVQQGTEPLVNCLVISDDDGTGNATLNIELLNITPGTSFAITDINGSVVRSFESAEVDDSEIIIIKALHCGSYIISATSSDTPDLPLGIDICDFSIGLSLSDNYSIKSGEELVLDLSCESLSATCSGINFETLGSMPINVDQDWALENNILTISNVNQSSVATLYFVDSEGDLVFEEIFEINVSEVEDCDNGIDDDDDGFVDCFDSECRSLGSGFSDKDLSKSGACPTDQAAAMAYIDFLNSEEGGDYWKLLKSVDELVGAWEIVLKPCEGDKRNPYREPGIIPHCFWDEQSGDPRAVKAYYAGMLDGSYTLLSGLDEMVEGLWGIVKRGAEIGYLMLLDHNVCHLVDLDSDTEITPEIYKEILANKHLLTNVSPSEREMLCKSGTFNDEAHEGFLNWRNWPLVRKVATYFFEEECAEAAELKKVIDQFREYLRSQNAIYDAVFGLFNLYKAADSEVETIYDDPIVAFYEFGRLIPDAIASEFGGAIVSGLAKLDGILNKLTRKVGTNRVAIDEIASADNIIYYVNPRFKLKGKYPDIADNLINDFPDVDDLNLFVNNDELVRAWNKVKTLKPTSKLSTDIDALAVISRQLDDADLMAKIGADRYDDIIKKFAGQCKTCDPPASGASESVKHLPSHDEMLETLETFTNKHHGKPGFDDVLNDLKSADPRKQKGSEFVTRILKDDNDIAGFEYQYIGGQNNTADWVTLNGKKIDGKSWSVTSSIDNIGIWDFPTQLKDYFANPPFEMWFDHLRFTKSSNSTYKAMSKAEATIHVKKQYQKLFQKPTKAQELFDHITNNGTNVQAFQDLFGVNNVNSFISNVVGDLDNVALYGAFKVK